MVSSRDQTKIRIDSNKSRARLYPQLEKGFLNWWDTKRRWRNEPFEFVPYSVKARLHLEELGATIKVENLLAVKIGDDVNRIIYPYFSEIPVLNEEAARLGLWALGKSLDKFSIDEMRVLDVLRGTSFATDMHPMRGDEDYLFVQKYKQVLAEWLDLRKDYN